MSATKKFGLGKGLGALIPEEIDGSSVNDDLESQSKIDINLVKPNSNQPRKNFDDEKIAELAQSIQEYGIIQPIIIRKENDFYCIIAGERRWRAAKSIGLKEIPCIIMDLSEKSVLEVSLIENIQREDLNPIEEAIAYKKLINDFNFTQEDLSIKIGKSRTAIANCMRLLSLDLKVQNYIIEGILSEGHGRAILAIENANLQLDIAQRVIDDKLSVRETEKLIRFLNSTKEKIIKDETERKNPYIIDIRGKLENYFGTKVNVKDSNNKGKIEIEYYSSEDLQRIIDTLNL